MNISRLSIHKHLVRFTRPFSHRAFSVHLNTTYRTHTCGELRDCDEHIGQRVRLCGWLESIRRFGPITFLTIRDRYGTTQLVLDKKELQLSSQRLQRENVMQIVGRVRSRPVNARNAKIETGDIEVLVETLEHLNDMPHASVPIPITHNAPQTSDELRLRYRYLDLRRSDLQQNLILRSKIALAVRAYLDTLGFLEIDTPTLFKSTPEGAREFLVPTRKPGLFYALAQSPQQYKQLLMVAGMDRYFQFAKCYRDESGRADRQPEFTQIDLEMSFVTQNEIMKVIEDLVRRVWKVAGIELCEGPFPSMSYAEAIHRFGVDKPDTRYAMELIDLSEECAGSIEKAEKDFVVRGLNASNFANCLNNSSLKKLRQFGQTFIDIKTKMLVAKVQKAGAPWIYSSDENVSSECMQKVNERLQAKPGDVIILAVGKYSTVSALLGRMRIHAASILHQNGYLQTELSASNDKLLWIVDFPLFQLERVYDLSDQSLFKDSLSSTHHPFTAPLEKDKQALMDIIHNLENPEQIDSASQRSAFLPTLTALKAQHMDLVCNGWEIGGGSIRIHCPKLQKSIFESILQLPPALSRSFEHLLEAFSYGAPPHGGIALGLDRMLALLCKAHSIRDVIAFPKSITGNEPMTLSPAVVEKSQLKEYHIKSI